MRFWKIIKGQKTVKAIHKIKGCKMTIDRLKRFLELKKKIFQDNKFVEVKNTAEEKEYNELAKEYVLMINDKIFNNV